MESWNLKIQRKITNCWSTDKERPQAFVDLDFDGVVKETITDLYHFRYDIYSEEITPIERKRKADKTYQNLRYLNFTSAFQRLFRLFDRLNE